ncbi:formate dehydrogenase subunit delta [Methyloligella solikamskensis]|uniref:Formate dehydrogenase subunit delta n=1 Tax=Methyloligella solikamskensis TaxID=1177756 RepID=A0ABW3JDJ7_9HYPH
MSHSTVDRLVYMANQIKDYFKYQRDADPAEEIADHLRLFWDPRMRRQIIKHFEKTGGEGLEGPALKAIELLRDHEADPDYMPTTATADPSGGREDPG